MRVNYWLTTHYPHYVDDNAEWCIYVPRGFEALVREFDLDDRVAIYEMGRGPDRDGKGRRPSGKQELICLTRGVGMPRSTIFFEQYAMRSGNERKTDFTLECPCDQRVVSSRDQIRRELLCEILGYNPNYNFHGFNGGAGFKQITEEQFAKIEQRFGGESDLNSADQRTKRMQQNGTT